MLVTMCISSAHYYVLLLSNYIMMVMYKRLQIPVNILHSKERQKVLLIVTRQKI